MEIEYRSVADFGEIITGKTPSTSVDKFWSGEIPFITPTDIVGYDMRYIFSTERQITDEGANSQINTILPKNTICVSCIASIGKMCITSAAQSITNQQINSIVVKKGYDYQYLFYLLRYFLPYIQLIGGGTGSGTPIISKAKFSKLKYPIFVDKAIQARIAVILSTYDSLIEVNNKRIKVLEQIAENLYKEWFVRFRFPGHEKAEFENGLPKGWRISTLGKEARFINGRAYLMPELQETGKYRIVRVGNFSGKDEWFFSDMELEKDKYCERGDLLYKWSCNFGPEIWNEEKAIYHYHIWKVLPGENMTKGFLFHYLSNSTKLWLSGTNGTAMAHITKASIEKKKIMVPSLEILKDFESYAQLIMDQGLSIKKQNENLIKQRDLLLPRLMSGKLEV